MLTTPEQLRDAWEELLLRYQWDWFVTLTFRPPGCPSPKQAERRFLRWTNRINRCLHGRRYYQKADSEIYWVLARERHRSGLVHLHALMGDTQNLNHIARRLDWMDDWYRYYGIARIDEITDKQTAVTKYVCKYVIKMGGGDNLEVSKSLRSYAKQQRWA